MGLDGRESSFEVLLQLPRLVRIMLEMDLILGRCALPEQLQYLIYMYLKLR